MRASDVVAIVAAVSVAVLVGALSMLLAALARTLRDLRAVTSDFTDAAVPLLGELRETVRGTEREVDRVERLVSAAEGVTDAVDSAQRLAYRTLASPVVKAMAFGAGVSRGARRLREGEDVPAYDTGRDTGDRGRPVGRGRRRGRGAS